MKRKQAAAGQHAAAGKTGKRKVGEYGLPPTAQGVHVGDNKKPTTHATTHMGHRNISRGASNKPTGDM